MTEANEQGEIIYDSIIENKEKTKKYWEELMMAATTAEQQKVQYHNSDKMRDLLSVDSEEEDGKPQSDVSELEYFDAQSNISTQSPENFDSLEHTHDDDCGKTPGPKIVETVAKKLLENNEINSLPVPVQAIIKSVESVIEQEIRLQKEKEEALCRERELALKKAENGSGVVKSQQQIQISPAPIPLPPSKPLIFGDELFDEKRNTVNSIMDTSPSAEVKIALELREMKEREEELRRLRQKLSTSKDEEKVISVDDGFNSIPNTDEGNFSEYGSEEKELSCDGSSSRVTSPEIPAQGIFSHQRTQSMDSVSSGHSSGCGTNEFYSTRRRLVVVKPFEDPDEDELPAYMRKQKETPIEREIRLAREREEELRREKGLPPINGSVFSAPTSAKSERYIRSTMLAKDPRSVQHRLATSRIQQEIDEATEREKELRAAGKIQTMSEDTVDSKVTRFSQLGEYSMEKEEMRLQRSTSLSNISLNENQTEYSPVHAKVHADPSIITAPTPPPTPTLPTVSRYPTTPVIPKQGFPAKTQRGLMERFIASRGKLNLITTTNAIQLTKNVSSPPSTYHTLASPVAYKPMTDVTSQDKQASENEESDRESVDGNRISIRPGYTSAEKKIEDELREMRKREEELRLQRAQMFGHSQPNLLNITDDEGEANEEDSDDSEIDHNLRTTKSIPNNLNFDDSMMLNGNNSLNKHSFGTRKKSALIAEWESKIQQNSES